jgi:hypothetical protein
VSAELAALTQRIQALEGEREEDRRKLQRLIDVEEVRQVKYRYFRALDSADMDLLRSVLTEDFNCHFWSDSFDLVANSRDEFVELMSLTFNADMATQHQGHHPEVTIGEDGHTAAATWYLQDIVHNLKTGRFIMGSNFYKDTYRRTDEGWKESSSSWGRHVEITEQLPFMPNYTGRYLKNHGRKIDG